MNPENTALHDLIRRFSQQKIIVIGDVILDEYLTGNAVRLSREAPIPVLEYMSRQAIPGGAANPSVNIAVLGAKTVQIGVIGADAEGENLREALSQRGVDISGIVVDELRPTTVKTRLMAHMGLRFPQQVARLDKFSRKGLTVHIEGQLEHALKYHIAGVGAILFSDYHICLNSLSLIEVARRLAGKTVLLSADAQGDFEKYAGFDVMKCNADEAQTFLRRSLVTDDDFARASIELLSELRLRRCMVITRGADGATAADVNGSVHVPTPTTTEVYDTVGAGDTAVAVITLALAAGATMPEAVTLANYAGGLVVRRVGNYAPSAAELIEVIGI
jgi:rfaE bifunctional protein kinase chain/domain